MSDPGFDALRRQIETNVRQPSFDVITGRRVRRTRRLAITTAAVVVVMTMTGTALSFGRKPVQDSATLPLPPVAVSESAPIATASPSQSPSLSPTSTPKPTSTPSADACAQRSHPDAACTGVPAGVSLTVVPGGLTITTANTLIDRKDIRGCVDVRAPGVVIRRSKVSCRNAIVVNSFAGAYRGAGLVIEDTEIHCGNTPGVAVADTNFTARRVDIHGCEKGFDIDTDVVVEDSYIHDLFNGPGSSSNGIQFGIGRNVTVNHNTIYANSGNSAISTHPTTTANVVISNNLLAGGSYALYCPSESSSNVRVVDNQFSRKFYPTVGAYGPWTYCEKVADRRGNIYAETRQGLP